MDGSEVYQDRATVRVGTWPEASSTAKVRDTASLGLSRYRVLKRSMDLLGAVVLSVVFSPLIAVVTVTLLRQGGPVFFAHTRIGHGGRPFKVLKFRTMVPNAQEVLNELLASSPEMRAEWERDHKLKDDPRVTAIGNFLRKTSLDELPQLWNVLKGEMSLVGPRPVVEAEIQKYGRAAWYYYACKPGLTGLWQVSGRNDTDYRRRVVMDRRYAQNASLWMDSLILIRTVSVVVFRRGAY